MAIAARYVSRELFSVLVVAMIVLVIVAVGGRFIGYLQEAALGKYPADSLLRLLWLRLPEFMQLLLPFAFFISLLITLGRLFAEREMVVLQGGGATTVQLLRWLAIPGLLIVACVAALTLQITPSANFQMKQFLVEQRARAEFDNVNPGVFLAYGRGARVTYAEEISDDRRQLFRVFLSENSEDQSDVIVWAKSGSQYVDESTGSRFLQLNDGFRYQGEVGTANYQVVGFKNLSQRITDDGRRPVRFSVESTPTATLFAAVDALSAAELHWRIALPIFTLVSGLLAVGLAPVRPRQGRFAKIVPGVGVFIAYYLLLLLNQNAIEQGQWSPKLGLWLVHLLFLAGAIFLLRRFDRPMRV